MMATKYSFLDQTNDAPDAIIFAGFFGVGVAIQIFGRFSLGWDAVFVAVILCLLLCLYAFAVLKFKQTKLSINAASDNFYFLGFLFTVITLAIALYRYSVDSSDKSGDQLMSIIGDLGVGLATTIWGLFLRMFFSLWRTSPDEIEEVVHNDLRKKAEEVRTSLASVASVSESANNRMIDVIQTTEKNISEIYEKAPANVEAMINNSLAKINALETNYVNSVNNLVNKINNVDVQQAPFKETFDDLSREMRNEFYVINKSLKDINRELTNMHIPDNTQINRLLNSIQQAADRINNKKSLIAKIFDR